MAAKCVIKEALILEASDWSDEEWKVIEQVFGVSCADKIMVKKAKVEAYIEHSFIRRRSA